MRVKSEDILKPGAVLIAEKINFQDPQIAKMLEENRRRSEQYKKWKRRPFKNVVITI